MTDRELLEWAAKAAGIELAQPVVYSDADGVYKARHGWWHPLEDDAHALQLAVAVKLQIHIDNGYGTAARRPDQMWQACEAHKYGGIEAATRRAIVRAAAAIGQQEGE
ncbi:MULTISPECIES: hypothetical protein [unclassified Polaromonas]|jgi:hypothetical protein|uniref:hypothetical protein n=1 Tax=unclassified Polaromonas TaxID=2638319 RepID=UPI000BCBD027|nr:MULTISPECIES: hypothetical protein [unclassified Polaromonas]OYY34742.1 MAG: hypothetical protein B7Y60_14975 [Polaromonas sp. 35-63-35]OYZ19373.1 MAG: hypothetical protein B7Y28_12615 [Polaromonas sp. 16-63-31]OYZ77502.1 MAG: hypothetical protein B7Y09_16125 [Polaromonas sp. 24-63-21]OZA48514.1 MAG: hypothetical protein B7X88_18385 [Polaromonas sp. 17-63-33]OZA87264.1 MAG: hypothetical protein B7X65_13865 [Polaromonas sp. 39-63-25]